MTEVQTGYQPKEEKKQPSAGGEVVQGMVSTAAKEAGKLAEEALPDEVRPAVEAFKRGFRQQRRQERPPYYHTRRLYMDDAQDTSQRLTAARRELSKWQKQPEQQRRIPYKNGVLVPWTPEQQKAEQRYLQEQEVKQFNSMRSQWEAEEWVAYQTRVMSKDKSLPPAHMPEYRTNPQKSPSEAVRRLIGATPQEYEAMAGRSKGSFAEHVRAWGWNEAARANRAQRGLTPMIEARVGRMTPPATGKRVA